MLQPPFQIEIFLHPSAAGVQHQAGKLQGLPIVQILFDQFFPFHHKLLRHLGISISRKIDEIECAVDTIKINRLRSTRGITCERQPFLPGESVNQTGLSYVTSP